MARIARTGETPKCVSAARILMTVVQVSAVTLINICSTVDQNDMQYIMTGLVLL